MRHQLFLLKKEDGFKEIHLRSSPNKIKISIPIESGSRPCADDGIIFNTEKSAITTPIQASPATRPDAARIPLFCISSVGFFKWTK